MKRHKHISLFEDVAVYSDPFYANSIFKIRYRQINDLSNKRSPDTIDKPVNDMLDQFQEGDLVHGKDSNGKKHKGEIIFIKKDNKGENVGIRIREDGKIINLIASSVKFQEGGDRGNRKRIQHEPVNTGSIDYADTFAPFTYESRLKRFSEFNGK